MITQKLNRISSYFITLSNSLKGTLTVSSRKEGFDDYPQLLLELTGSRTVYEDGSGILCPLISRLQ